ncbi:restriction endonuclease subunit S [Bacillus licheniformis]|uniref:restriction endonuclease subunit S n=1 Tax=Bacillus licheniformis TaxID=1402 RepID=UPI001C234415|nr:restriction endonuclease subunit S [Bacillus licheniformis]MBU8802498.1 restriction endonuclease subunit S [Bacillus licheniformis]
MKPEIKERIDKIKRGEMPDGYKTSKIGVIPEDWDVKHLEDISNINPRKEALDENDTVSFISMSDVSDDARLISYQPRLYKEVFKGFTSFRDGDVLVAKITPCFENGKGALVDNLINKTGFGSTEFHVLRSKKNGDELFIYYHTVTDRFRKIGEKNMTGTAGQKRIATDFVKGFLIPYPRNDIERKKIASILSTWDKAIELKEKLIEQKKQQKKGLMQKLLTGEVRLPGFKGEWISAKIGEIGKTYNGLSGKTAEDFGAGKPYIPYKTIFDDTKIDIAKLDYVQIQEGENQNRAKYGDIFFTTSSETPNEVGMSSVLLDEVDELYLNSFCFGYRLNNFNVLLPEFAQFLFRGNDFRRKIFGLAQGSTRFNISKNEIMKIEVQLPSIEEQKSIAAILIKSDREIKLLQKQVEYLKEQKKGLMQLLLTGKVRVQV